MITAYEVSKNPGAVHLTRDIVPARRDFPALKDAATGHI